MMCEKYASEKEWAFSNMHGNFDQAEFIMRNKLRIWSRNARYRIGNHTIWDLVEKGSNDFFRQPWSNVKVNEMLIRVRNYDYSYHDDPEPSRGFYNDEI